MAPAIFRHPQASHETLLQGVTVAYLLRRSQRRSLGFLIHPDGLVVSAPQRASLYAVEAALQEKAGWIVRKLAALQERLRQQDAARMVWQDGALLPFLGAPLRLVLAGAGANGQDGQDGLGAAAALATGTLQLALPLTASAAQIRTAAQAWLVRQAQQRFTERLNHFAPLLQVQWRRLSLSNAATRWGSARVDGSIRLNWRLIHLDVALLDYVVVHELSHLREMNHSPRFWAVVASVLPNHLALRRRLKAEATPSW